MNGFPTRTFLTCLAVSCGHRLYSVITGEGSFLPGAGRLLGIAQFKIA